MTSDSMKHVQGRACPEPEKCGRCVRRAREMYRRERGEDPGEPAAGWRESVVNIPRGREADRIFTPDPPPVDHAALRRGAEVAARGPKGRYFGADLVGAGWLECPDCLGPFALGGGCAGYHGRVVGPARTASLMFTLTGAPWPEGERCCQSCGGDHFDEPLAVREIERDISTEVAAAMVEERTPAPDESRCRATGAFGAAGIVRCTEKRGGEHPRYASDGALVHRGRGYGWSDDFPGATLDPRDVEPESLAEPDAGRDVARAVQPCIGNDATCPCQDGDPCHYRDHGDTKAMSPPATPENIERAWEAASAPGAPWSRGPNSLGSRADFEKLCRDGSPSAFSDGTILAYWLRRWQETRCGAQTLDGRYSYKRSSGHAEASHRDGDAAWILTPDVDVRDGVAYDGVGDVPDHHCIGRWCLVCSGALPPWSPGSMTARRGTVAAGADHVDGWTTKTQDEVRREKLERLARERNEEMERKEARKEHEAKELETALLMGGRDIGELLTRPTRSESIAAWAKEEMLGRAGVRRD